MSFWGIHCESLHIRSVEADRSFVIDREILNYKDLTQRELAEKIHEQYNTLQSWINRDRLPNAEQSVKIADALNTSVEFLVTGKNNRKKIDHSKTIKLLKEAIANLENDV